MFREKGGYVCVLPNGYGVTWVTTVTVLQRCNITTHWNQDSTTVLVVGEGCGGHEDGVQKTRIFSVKLWSSCSLHDAPRSIAFPNNRSSLTSYNLELPSAAWPPFVASARVASSRPRRQDCFSGTAYSKPALLQRASESPEGFRVPNHLSSKNCCSLIQLLQHV